MDPERTIGHLETLFAGTTVESAEIHTLEAPDWRTRWASLGRSHRGPQDTRVVGFEILDRLRSSAVLDERFDKLESNDIRGYYFAISDRSTVEVVRRWISARSLGDCRLYGVDPDYYFALVPLSGGNHRNVERYVLGLKPALGKKAKVRQVIKSLLIMIGLSSRLYEAFLIVVDGN